MSNKVRGFVTVAMLFLWGSVNWLLNKAAPIISANLAGKQFENSDTSYVVSQTSHFFTGSGLPTVLLLIVLVLVWWNPLKNVWTKAFVAAMIGALLFGGAQAHAYYDQKDWPEVHFILPNESAFYIPDVGANKDSQAKFGSEEYLQENKIPAKRFQIPHVKLEGSAYFRDYYVPAGRLIIVDRTPFNREWVSGGHRGTSDKDQSFPCQSKEGLDISVGVAIGTSVLEENAPRFLYRFGVKPPEGDRNKPEVIFTSVFQGRGLHDVMDGVVRNKVQSLVCKEFTTREFEKGSSEAMMIMSTIETSVKTYLDSVGITLDFIGWADTFSFNETVQKAINDRYAADKIGPVLPILQQQADIKVKEGLGKGLEKRLPNTLLVPPDMLSGLMGTSVLKTVPGVPTTAPPK